MSDKATKRTDVWEAYQYETGDGEGDFWVEWEVRHKEKPGLNFPCSDEAQARRYAAKLNEAEAPDAAR